MIATLNGEPIYLSEIEQSSAFQIYRLRANIHSLIEKETEELVNQKLLAAEAARRGMSIDELLRKEVDEKVTPPGENEMEEYLRKHPKDVEFSPQRKIRIRTYLSQRVLIERRLEFLASLRRKAEFKFFLAPPERPRIKVGIAGEPWRGAGNAPVTLVHFAGLTSKLSAESSEKIRRLFTDFQDKIKWVHRNYFDIHDEKALLAAEIGEAAHDQNIFWKYHDRLLAQKGDIKMEAIKKMAEEIGFNPKKFEEGQKRGAYLLRVKDDIGYGARIGVEGASVLFINGLYFSGTFPYEELKALVRTEWERTKGSKRGGGL